MPHEKLRQAMRQKGVTAYWLAKTTRINTPGLYQAINGQIPLWPGWRKRIAEAMDVPESDLFEEDPE